MPTVSICRPYDEVPDSVKPYKISEDQLRDFARSIAVEGHEEEVLRAATKVLCWVKLDSHSSGRSIPLCEKATSWRRYFYNDIRDLVGESHLLPCPRKDVVRRQ